ncbi:MAG: HAD family phosphatase [Clostridia bacterium]|nr:HAD family phosphatase [Clostridia bacterium]
MDIKLLSLDLDGTLLTDDKRITAPVKEALKKAEEKGVHVVLCTGRMLPSVTPLYEELELDSPAICCNGACVTLQDGTVIIHNAIDKDTVQRVLKYANDNGIYIQQFIDNKFYSQQSGELLSLYESRAKIKAVVVDDIAALNMPADKLLMIQRPDILDKLPLVQAAFPELNVLCSSNDYIEITHKDANKGKALKALGEYYGLNKDQIMAIGDGMNDLPMLLTAGHSVAMGNSVQEVKDACELETLSNMEDGVAYAVHKWILEDI